ncbi:galactokinase family protein [Gemmatimonas sp.]|uniref:galactokinase family protein n=1 Tax=Gemmatimonas sp. TaxID=1962908 RepID=UPI00286E2115|nr:galactokinase family protein [Gemmatimonas sp.]
MTIGAFPPLSELFVRRRFDSVGFSPLVANAYRSLLRDAHQALDDASVPSDHRRVWILPGRIEVLGKHVDYAGGRSLLCTVERGIVLVARRRNDRVAALRDARRRESITISFDAPARSALPWAVYPRTVLRRLIANFGSAVCGADIALASNLPPAAGVSSSSALTVGLTLAFAELSALSSLAAWRTTITDRAALAGYIGALENGADYGRLAGERGVGTLGGAQDQTAILCGEPDRLEMFRWGPVTYERSVPWLTDSTFVIGVSGVVAAKTGAAKERYNRAARTAHRLVDAWNLHGGVLAATPARTLREAFEAASNGPVTHVPSILADAARAGADSEFTANHLIARLEQFFDETFVIVPHAADALVNGDVKQFGALVDRSQGGAERALENQIAETVHLARYARELGAHAASAFGAGFGGSVWAMVPSHDAERFASRWRDRYLRTHGSASHRALFFATRPTVPALEVVDDDTRSGA